MDRNPHTAAAARVHVKTDKHGRLLTVAIIHEGQLCWHRERIGSKSSLSDSCALAVKNAAKRFELPVVQSQGVLPGL